MKRLVRLDVLRSLPATPEPTWAFRIDLMRQWIARRKDEAA